jgi:hypothetical protein
LPPNKKCYGLDRGYVATFGSRRDLRRDDGSRLASARLPSGLTEPATVGKQLVLNDMLAFFLRHKLQGCSARPLSFQYGRKSERQRFVYRNG